jgi:hypothetical protein
MAIILKKQILRNIGIFLVATVLFWGSTLPCFAAGCGSVAVTLEDKEKNKITGATVHMCQIAELNRTDYYPTEAFEDSGISMSGIINSPDESTAKTLLDYVMEKEIETLSAVSDDGSVLFENLRLGIWLVYCDAASAYVFNPYIVFLPYKTEAGLSYDVESVPKLEENKPNQICIYVMKKWQDKDNAAKRRPDSVCVDLLEGEAIVDTVELSNANGWAHTFEGLAKDGSYSVQEKEVKDYTAQYSGDEENGFVITNTYVGGKLPQTGQYWWPIAIMGIAGICFILLAVIEFGAKKDEE